MVSYHFEFVQNHVAHFFLVAKRIVVTLGFLVEFLVVQEIAFECSHLGLVECWRILTAPQVPDVVLGKEFFFALAFVEVSGTDQVSHLFEQRLALVLLALDFDFTQGAVFVQWNGCMEQQVRVGHRIHATVAEDVADVLLELFAAQERTVQLGNDFLFFVCQLVWIVRVDGREVAVLHRIFLSVDGDDATFVVDAVQQHTVVHFEFRTALDGFCFQLELDDTDGLVHLCQEAECLRVADGFARHRTQAEQGTWVVGISFHGEGSQW